MNNPRVIVTQLREALKQTDMRIKVVNNDYSQIHFSVNGPAGTMFEGGIYHGKIILPKNFPFSAPSIQLLSNSGRFELNKDICINGYTAWHSDTWSPAINVSAIVRAV
jgi:ubiquitin-protein ligase